MNPTERRPNAADNLKLLRRRKQRQLALLMRKQKKLGQLKAWDQARYLVNKEIEKELKDLALIEEDLNELTKELCKNV